MNELFRDNLLQHEKRKLVRFRVEKLFREPAFLETQQRYAIAFTRMQTRLVMTAVNVKAYVFTQSVQLKAIPSAVSA